MLQRSSHVLGKGGTATIFLGRVRTALQRHGGIANDDDDSPGEAIIVDQPVAVKQRFRALRSSPGRDLEPEHELMLAIPTHPHVMPVTASCVVDDFCHYAMPLMDSDLGLELKRRNRPSEAQALAMIRDLLSGLAHVHEAGIAHRDVKPSNALVIRDDTADLGVRIVIGDFGVAHRVDMHYAQFATNACGTRYYQPPEQLSGQLRQDAAQSCDVWAVGCVLYELIAGQVPFKGDTAIEALQSILTDFGASLEQWFNPASSWATSAHRGVDVPFVRRSQLQALSAATRSLLLGLLDINPATRLTCRDALQHDALTQLGVVPPYQLHGYRPIPALETLVFTDLNSLDRDLCSTAQATSGSRSTERRGATASGDRQGNSVLPIADGRRITLSSASVNAWLPPDGKGANGTGNSLSPQRRTLCFDDSDDDQC